MPLAEDMPEVTWRARRLRRLCGRLWQRRLLCVAGEFQRVRRRAANLAGPGPARPRGSRGCASGRRGGFPEAGPAPGGWPGAALSPGRVERVVAVECVQLKPGGRDLILQ